MLRYMIVLNVFHCVDLIVTRVCCDSQVKWHEICLSIPAAILEVLNAWENGVLSVEAVQVRPSHNPPSRTTATLLFSLICRKSCEAFSESLM